MQNMWHEQGANVEFCVTSIHAKRRERERRAGATWSPEVASRRNPTLQRDRDRVRQTLAGHASSPNVFLTCANPWSAFTVQFLPSLLPSFTTCLRRLAGLTRLPDTSGLAVKLRTWRSEAEAAIAAGQTDRTKASFSLLNFLARFLKPGFKGLSVVSAALCWKLI